MEAIDLVSEALMPQVQFSTVLGTCRICNTGPETPEHLWYRSAHSTSTFDVERMFMDLTSLNTSRGSSHASSPRFFGGINNQSIKTGILSSPVGMINNRRSVVCVDGRT